MLGKVYNRVQEKSTFGIRPLYVQAGADYEAQVWRASVIAGAKRDAVIYAYARS
jgi:hypothetical protein